MAPLFDLALAHGRCVGVRIPPGSAELDALADSALLAEERAFAGTLAGGRRRSWIGGRVALRQALAAAGLACGEPVFADDRGAPLLPAGLLGSISHKDEVAVALVAPADGGGRTQGGGRARIGVDVEVEARRTHDIARRVLTESEVLEIAGLDDVSREREVLVRFSAKEAVYKAIDPFVRRYVGFEEVAVTPLPGGEARVTAALRGGEGPFAIAVSWQRVVGVVITTARVAAA